MKMKSRLSILAMAVMFLITPVLACDVDDGDKDDGIGLFDMILTFISWDKTDMLDNGTLSSELSSTMAENAYSNGIDMGIVKFYNPDQKVGYYFAYTIDEAGEVNYIDAENDIVYTSIDSAKQRLSYRGIEFTNIVYSEFYPNLDVIDTDMDNTIPGNIIVN